MGSSGGGSIGLAVNGGDNCSGSTHSAGSAGQTPSCRALAGSLTSFDTTVAANTEGTLLKQLQCYIDIAFMFKDNRPYDKRFKYDLVFLGIPLLEENEVEREGSNSSEPGDTLSATGSETSSK